MAHFGPKMNTFGFFSKICSLGFYGITLDEKHVWVGKNDCFYF